MQNPVTEVQKALETAGFTVKVDWNEFDETDPSVEIVGTPYEVQVSDYASIAGGIYSVGWWETPEEMAYCNSPLFKTPEQVVAFVREKAAA